MAPYSFSYRESSRVSPPPSSPRRPRAVEIEDFAGSEVEFGPRVVKPTAKPARAPPQEYKHESAPERAATPPTQERAPTPPTREHSTTPKTDSSYSDYSGHSGCSHRGRGRSSKNQEEPAYITDRASTPSSPSPSPSPGPSEPRRGISKTDKDSKTGKDSKISDARSKSRVRFPHEHSVQSEKKTGRASTSPQPEHARDHTRKHTRGPSHDEHEYHEYREYSRHSCPHSDYSLDYPHHRSSRSQRPVSAEFYMHYSSRYSTGNEYASQYAGQYSRGTYLAPPPASGPFFSSTRTVFMDQPRPRSSSATYGTYLCPEAPLPPNHRHSGSFLTLETRYGSPGPIIYDAAPTYPRSTGHF